jgi:hypothetical protein
MKRDIADFRYICKKHGMSDAMRRQFSEWLHRLKRHGNRGSKANGDFTKAELDDLAAEFLGKQ